MNISRQVKELRKLSEAYTACGHKNVGNKLRQAADTIESLYKKQKWISCTDHLPEATESTPYDTLEAQIRDGTLQEYIVMIYGAAKPTTLWYIGNGDWYDPYTGQNYIVTKWMPLPTCLSSQAAVQKGDNP